jgi:hypothetical protein
MSIQSKFNHGFLESANAIMTATESQHYAVIVEQDDDHNPCLVHRNSANYTPLTHKSSEEIKKLLSEKNSSFSQDDHKVIDLLGRVSIQDGNRSSRVCAISLFKVIDTFEFQEPEEVETPLANASLIEWTKDDDAEVAKWEERESSAAAASRGLASLVVPQPVLPLENGAHPLEYSNVALFDPNKFASYDGQRVCFEPALKGLERKKALKKFKKAEKPKDISQQASALSSKGKSPIQSEGGEICVMPPKNPDVGHVMGLKKPKG